MIRIFRRHLQTCPHTSERDRRCRCPIHAEGTIGTEPIRRSLNLTSWEAATRLIRDWENAGTSVRPFGIGLDDARARFLADLEIRNISRSSRRKNEILLTRLKVYMDDKGFTLLNQLGVAQIREFRESWTSWGPLTHIKYIERLRAFFRFSIQNKWIIDNPTEFLKPPQAPKTRAVPFTDAQLTDIHAAITKPRTRAFVFALQYTGLRIGDCVKLRKGDIVDGKLCIQTQKRKTIVWLPLPPFVLSALEQIRTTEYYFWSGQSKLSCAVGSWRRSLDLVFKNAEVTGNPHKFRHTFATNLLLNNVPVEQVARILGNSPRVVEKHYDHFIRERQEQLEIAVRRTWQPGLMLVKK